MKPRFLIFIILLVPISLNAAEVTPGMVADTDLSILQKKAEQVFFSVEKVELNGEDFLDSVSDFHAVFDLELKEIAAVIADHDNGEKVFSRMVDTVDLNPEDDLSVPHKQTVHNSAKFLGIGQDYRYTTIVSVETNTDDEFSMRWKMIECEEGNFEDYIGFWYLKRIDSCEDKPLTYVRLYAKTLFNNPIPFQEMVMNLVTEGETRDVFASLYSAAAE